jgi:hypothetical protein
MKESAVDHYKNRRGNCAQSVALAWKDKRAPESEDHLRFSGYGHGQAPEGLCGALHAARELAGSRKDVIQSRFCERTGGYTACRDIRRNRIMPCSECVAVAAEILEETSKETAA